MSAKINTNYQPWVRRGSFEGKAPEFFSTFSVMKIIFNPLKTLPVLQVLDTGFGRCIDLYRLFQQAYKKVVSPRSD